MITTLRFVSAISLCLGWIVAASAQEENPQQIVARILSDWKARQDRIRTIQVEVSGTNFYPMGRWDEDSLETPAGKALLAKLGRIPAKDTSNPVRAKFLLQLDTNWARKELEWMIMHRDTGLFALQHTTHLYNGDQIRVYRPREKNTSETYTPSKTQPDLWMQTNNYSNNFFSIEDSPIFWGCGSVPLNGTDPKNLKVSLDPRSYQFKGFGQIQGRRCVVLRTPNLMPKAEKWCEFWIDPKLNSAVVRAQLYLQGKLSYQIDAEWRQLEADWFPMKWNYSHYFNSDAGPRLSTAFELSTDRVVLNPSLSISDFDVKLKPKMVVFDVEQNNRGVVAADGKTLLPISALDAPPRWRMPSIILICCGTALAVFFLGRYFRSRWAIRATH